MEATAVTFLKHDLNYVAGTFGISFGGLVQQENRNFQSEIHACESHSLAMKKKETVVSLIVLTHFLQETQ